MKKTIPALLTAVIIMSNIAYASIVISQVLYNPNCTESGGEAVELCNNGDSDTDISGWVLMTEASQADAAIPENTILCPGCYYLVADAGWNESRDSLSWPLADHEEPINLYNSNSGIAIANNGTIIDAVGWGSASDIDSSLYEGEPAEEADEGYALARDSDTGNNLNDFSSQYPYFRSSSDLGTGAYAEEISVSFSTSSVSIISVNVTPDEGLDGGIQVFPKPGGEKQITVSASVEGEVGSVTASFSGIEKAMAFDGTSYSCSFDIGHSLAPGIYTLTVSAGAASRSVEVEIMKTVSIAVSGEIAFDEITAGSSVEEDITIENTGNSRIDMGFSASNLESEGSSISVKSIEYSLGDEYYTMSSNTQIRKAGLDPGDRKSVSIRISIPDYASGEYYGRITIIGVGAE